MIRSKKIRGFNRILKRIDTWVVTNKQLDLEYVKSYQRDYTKVWVQPYSNLCIGNSVIPAPKGKVRQKIIDGLFEIHSHWKNQLETLNTPYYLKIWFYHPDISRSQVVCAIGDFISFYDTTFHNPNENKSFPFDKRELQWEHRIDEDHITKDDICEPDDYVSMEDFLTNKKWIEKIMKHPKTRITEDVDENKTTTYYSFKNSDVWLGSSN
jgi:hypothetical protein